MAGTQSLQRSRAFVDFRGLSRWALLVFTTLVIGLFGAGAANAGLIRDSETEAFLRDINDPIFRAAGLNPKSVRIYIVNDGSVNAFVTAGQRMFYHTGLLLKAENPNQIAGVAAHETGHIAGGHLARGREGLSSASTPGLVVMGLGIIATIAGAPDVGLALLTGGATVAQRSVLAYTRVQEAAADQAAVTYLDQVGWSSEGLIEFFEFFREQQIIVSNGRGIDPYAVTHPLGSDRIQALRNRVSKSPFTGQEMDPELSHRFEMIKAKLWGFLDPYNAVLNRFPTHNTSKPARYARAIAYYRDGRVDQAVAEIDSLIAEEPKNQYFHELKGQILYESGRAEDAIASYKTARELSPDEPLLSLGYATTMLAADKTEADRDTARKALEILRVVAREDDENGWVFRQMAIAHYRMGDIGEANLATAEQYFRVRRYAEAREFAMRAKDKLPRGSQSWLRALDIIEVGTERAQRESENKRNPFGAFEVRTRIAE